VLSMSIDELIAVAENATISADICLKETSTFERMYEPSPTLFIFGAPIKLDFCPLFGPIDWTGDNQHLSHYNPVSNDSDLRSGHNSIVGARLKIVYLFHC